MTENKPSRQTKGPRLVGVGLVLLFAFLLLLPSLLRAVSFGWRPYHARPYRGAEVPQPDHAAVVLPTVERVEATDPGERVPIAGQVVVDRAHGNELEDADLNVLYSRLTARGLEIVPAADPGPAWSELLRAASALVVISPHVEFTAAEVEAVQRFVEQGGRVVLMGDPSRYAVQFEVHEVLGEVGVPRSDVAALNSLASPFGLSFADDYLYNTAENAGNFQYVYLRDFSPSPLTEGLEEVVFFSAHSMATDEETLLSADENTISSLSERRGDMAAMSLGGEGQVLAVGDFTFMTEPYKTTADNDRLIGNVADFMAGAQRSYGLADYPLFYGPEADLAYLADPAGEAALPAEFVAQAARLQSAFEAADKTLVWHARPGSGVGAGQGTLYIGHYAGLAAWPEVGEILAGRGISFTLETAEQALAAPTPTPLPTPTLSEEEGESEDQVQATPTPTPVPLRDWIHVPGLGVVEAKENALFYRAREGGQQTLIVLAFDPQGLASVVDRLLSGAYGDCLVDEERQYDLALCPAAYTPGPGTPGGEPPAPDPGPTPEGGEGPPLPEDGGILVVADDNGEGVYEQWTSAFDFADMATQAGYQVTLWATSVEGEVDLERMSAYQAVIWCTGDYRKEGGIPSADDLATMFAYLGNGGRLILSGAYVGGVEEGEQGLLLDLEVTGADHPLADGFEAGEVISLERFTAEEDYVTTVLIEGDAQAIVFSRGPESELAGRPAITVAEGATSGSRMVLIGLPIFLMPYEQEVLLANNAMRWVLE